MYVIDVLVYKLCCPSKSQQTWLQYLVHIICHHWTQHRCWSFSKPLMASQNISFNLLINCKQNVHAAYKSFTHTFYINFRKKKMIRLISGEQGYLRHCWPVNYTVYIVRSTLVLIGPKCKI